MFQIPVVPIIDYCTYDRFRPIEKRIRLTRTADLIMIINRWSVVLRMRSKVGSKDTKKPKDRHGELITLGTPMGVYYCRQIYNILSHLICQGMLVLKSRRSGLAEDLRLLWINPKYCLLSTKIGWTIACKCKYPPWWPARIERELKLWQQNVSW